MKGDGPLIQLAPGVSVQELAQWFGGTRWSVSVRHVWGETRTMRDTREEAEIAASHMVR